MKISTLLKQGNPVFSCEFFPPKTPEGVAHLFETIQDLKLLSPSFVSVTYGAGGSTRALTVDLVKRIKNEIGIETMAHLTCVGAGKEEIDAILLELSEGGIENVLALRGDPPDGQAFVCPPDGFSYSSDLIAYIRGKFQFSIGGACYPEGHIDCGDIQKEIAHLSKKVDAGIDFAITQLFFENSSYFRFMEQLYQSGIRIPILPGIMPITNLSQVKRFTKMCGATIPKILLSALEPVQEDVDAVMKIGVQYATEQCLDLLRHGAPGIHFYTLNKSTATHAILSQLRRGES